jgi:ribA/ribD-fused uncharacterized protein
MQVINSFTKEFRFLSNFYPHSMMWEYFEPEYTVIHYPTLEHIYQSFKTHDIAIKKHIATLTAGQAKRYARTIQLREDWELIKLPIMESLVRTKFCRGELKEMLLATKGFELVEGNNWGDTFWGVCKGQGENHLGKILMRTRDWLENESR